MNAPVLLTIDTELMWKHEAAGLGWRENLSRSYHAAGVGIPYQLQVLKQHGLKACFFVDPMPALVHGTEAVKQMVAPILNAGQEVQLHLHPFWADLAAGREPLRFELNGMSAEEQTRLIGTARDLLIEAGGPEPAAYRAGSFAADSNTLVALRHLGIRYDSSHNGSHQPWPSALPLAADQIAPVEIDGIVELPVAHIRTSGDALRHMQICALSSSELSAALAHAVAAGHPLTTIVSHSFELATRDGRRVNAIVKRRFERLCRLLDEHRDVLPMVHIRDLEGLRLGSPAAPLHADRLRSARRAASQAWSNLRHERPAEAVTAVGGTSFESLQALLPLIGL